MHVHETADEILQSERTHGLRPLARLDRMGLVGPGLIAVHAVHLDAPEIDLLARKGCHVVHCPASNLKLASGFAPVSELLGAGVNVGIGTDGAASNDRLDLLGEMRLAALLAKGVAGDAGAVPAHRALAMATLAGARALGLAERIGSLEAGKEADMVAVRLSDFNTAPCFDPVASLVYSAERSQVAWVWVAGEPVVVDGRLARLDAVHLDGLTAAWGSRVLAR
jgi:5-methylthioadenosine/S-adenosylhomocysteine deaminase